MHLKEAIQAMASGEAVIDERGFSYRIELIPRAFDITHLVIKIKKNSNTVSSVAIISGTNFEIAHEEIEGDKYV